MSIRGGRAGGSSAVDDESGNSEQDWEIFDILCKENVSLLLFFFLQNMLFVVIFMKTIFSLYFFLFTTHNNKLYFK